MKLIALVAGGHIVLELARQFQRITIDLQPLFHRQCMFRRIKVRQIRQQKTQRVTDTAIRFDNALENLLGDRQLARIIRARHPQPQDVGAEFIHDLLRRHDIALGLAHLLALAVNDKAVGQ